MLRIRGARCPLELPRQEAEPPAPSVFDASHIKIWSADAAAANDGILKGVRTLEQGFGGRAPESGFGGGAHREPGPKVFLRALPAEIRGALLDLGEMGAII